MGRVADFRGLGGNNVYVSVLSGQYRIWIGSTFTVIDDTVTGIHKVGNKIIISYGTSIANYTTRSTQPIVSNRRLMGTISGIDTITSLTVFGDKLLVAGNVNNTAILFEMDYDLTTNTISNIEQVTGTFLQHSPLGMTTLNNKLIVYGVLNDRFGIYDFDYTAVDLRTKTISDSITPTDSLGTMVVHNVPKVISEEIIPSDSVLADPLDKTVTISEGKPIQITDGAGRLTTLWTLGPNGSIESSSRLVLRNNRRNQDHLLASRTYTDIDPFNIRFSYRIRTISNSTPHYIRVVVDGVNYDTPDIPINQGANVWQTIPIEMEGLPSGVTDVRVELRSRTGITNFRLYSFTLFGPKLIDDAVSATAFRIPVQRLTEPITPDDTIFLEKHTTTTLTDNTTPTDNISADETVTSKLADTTTTEDAVSQTITKSTKLYDALFGNPNTIFDNFNDGTQNRHGWNRSVSNNLATARPGFLKTYPNWRPNESVLVIDGIQDTSGTEEYRIKITANGKEVIFGPFQSTSGRSSRTIIIPDGSFPNIRSDVTVEFFADEVNAFTFFIRSVRFSESSQISDDVGITSLITISDNTPIDDSVRFVNSPLIRIMEDLEIDDFAKARVAQELKDAIIVADSIGIIKEASRTILDNTTTIDDVNRFRTEEQTIRDDADNTDTIQTSKFRSVTLSDGITAIDILKTETHKFITILENTVINSVLKITKSATRTLTDSKIADDILEATTRPFKRFAESAGTDDDITTRKYASRTLTDQTTPDDSIEEYRTNERKLEEQTRINSVLSYFVAFGRDLADHITPNDKLKIEREAIISLSDDTSPDDSVRLEKLAEIRLTISTIIDDALEVTTRPFKNLADSITTINDTISIKREAIITIPETITTNAKVSLRKLADTTLKETTTIIDHIVSEAGKIVQLKETTSRTDGVFAGTFKFVGILEHVVIDDGTRLIKERTISLYDKLRIRDRLSGPSTGIVFKANTSIRKIFKV